ncbi:MAG: glyoxalase/bleomycin resistance/extradiol dioxygenase family protein [Raineya sp.]|jgi:hypothetical protein|nr:glyoxalase/bleomycin resistance/extradiol dioxygenase family protein [Raineya sp.]
MSLKLLVLRTQYLDNTVRFYSLLGLVFQYHQHQNSPFHYSTTINGTIFEIYPLAKEQENADKYTRLGFEVEDLQKTVISLQENNFDVSQSQQTEFGIIAIAIDPDGRKVEIYQK